METSNVVAGLIVAACRCEQNVALMLGIVLAYVEIPPYRSQLNEYQQGSSSVDMATVDQAPQVHVVDRGPQQRK